MTHATQFAAARELPEVLTTREAAPFLNRAPQTLRRWACSGGPITPLRINRRLARRVCDLRRLLRRRTAVSCADLVSRLHGVKDTGSKRWIAPCPPHDDKRPSLSIRELDDGGVTSPLLGRVRDTGHYAGCRSGLGRCHARTHGGLGAGNRTRWPAALLVQAAEGLTTPTMSLLP